MSRRAARFTQEAINNAVHEASARGKNHAIRIDKDGSISIIKLAPAENVNNEPDSFVYFIKCGDFIKIGVSVDPVSRLKSMKTGNPYDMHIIKKVHGYIDDERCFHERFSKLRHRDEWFRFDGELKDWLTRDEEGSQ